MAALTAPAPHEESPHHRHTVVDDEDVGAVRRAVTSLATTCGGIASGTAALIATELATNIVRHTEHGGEMLFRPVTGGIELVAVDRGPGIPHAHLRQRDAPWRPPPVTSGRARSSPAGPGLGLGLTSVARLATTFDLYSTEPGGTVVVARLLDSPPATGWCRWGGVNVAVDAGGDSGDRWAVVPGDALSALVVDGLGHGPDAAAAARAAVSAFAGQGGIRGDPGAFVATAHRAMSGTRGGVLAVCAVDPVRGELRYASVGNISGRVLHRGRSQSLVGRDGTVGSQIARPAPFPMTQPWRPGTTLVLVSDGIRSRWNPLEYPNLLVRDPTVVAATLLRDHGRSNDDACVLVIQDLRSERGDD